MFSFHFPKDIDVSFKVSQVREQVIPWARIREGMSFIAQLVGAPLHEDGPVFTIKSSNLSRLYALTRAMVALYDAYYDTFEGETKIPPKIMPVANRIPPALVVHLQSNALQPHSQFVNLLNEVVGTFGLGIFFEPVAEGVFIFVQDRPSFDFITAAASPSFVDAVITAEDALRKPEPVSILKALLQQLGVPPSPQI